MKFINLIFSLFLINLILCRYDSEQKIKLCNFTTHCPQSGKEFSVHITFNKIPNTISDGELIKYSDSQIRLKSPATLSNDKKSVIYKFVPELLGKYYLQFNKNLRCPDEITVKKNIGIDKLTGTIFLTESAMNEKFEIKIDMKFNQSFTYGEDISNIHLEQKSTSNQKSEVIVNATSCIMKNENKDLTCHFLFENGLEYKTKTRSLYVYYTNRCNEVISLGYTNIMKAIKKENNLLSTYLEALKIYLMGKYKSDKKTLITLLYDSSMKNQKIFIEDYAANLANIYTDFIFTMMDWKDGDFIASHFGVKDNGYIHITIVDFSNDNEYAGEIRSSEELTAILENLQKYTLRWTSQSLMQRIFTHFRIKINADEESKFNWYFGIFGFIFIIGLRCFFFARKMAKDQANFQVNPNPKKEQ
jgi:hypothetical protein